MLRLLAGAHDYRVDFRKSQFMVDPIVQPPRIDREVVRTPRVPRRLGP